MGDGKRTLALINGADIWTSDNDYVDGGKGNDLIKAFDGNDILIGGIGGKNVFGRRGPKICC